MINESALRKRHLERDMLRIGNPHLLFYYAERLEEKESSRADLRCVSISLTDSIAAVDETLLLEALSVSLSLLPSSNSCKSTDDASASESVSSSSLPAATAS